VPTGNVAYAIKRRLVNERKCWNVLQRLPMTLCPSDETLALLLADVLAVPERDALAQHVEGCA